MSKTSKKVLQVLGLTAGTAASLAILASALILQYSSRGYDQDELNSKRYALNLAKAKYANAYDNSIQHSADTLSTNPEYLSLIAHANEISRQMEDGEYKSASEYYLLQNQLDNILTRADSLAEILRSDYIDNDAQLAQASEYLQHMQYAVARLQRDSIIADKNNSLPLKDRFQNGMNMLRADFHGFAAARHLEKLQKINQKSR